MAEPIEILTPAAIRELKKRGVGLDGHTLSSGRIVRVHHFADKTSAVEVDKPEALTEDERAEILALK